MMKKRIGLLLVLTMALSVVLAGCTPQTTPTTPGTPAPTTPPATVDPLPGSDRGNVLTIGGTSPAGVFNPLFSETVYDRYVVELAFDSLLSLTKEGELTTDDSLSSAYTQSEDGKVITFKLRDVKWFDGTPVTADDVLFSFNTVFSKDYTGPLYSNVFDTIVGAKAVKDGTATEATGVKKVDDKTVEFTVTEALATTIREIVAVTPVQKAYYNKGTMEAIQELNRTPMGNGAFKLKTYAPEQYVEMEPNKDYWQGAPKLDGIIYKVVANTDELTELQVGSIDAVNFEGSIENYETIKGDEFKHTTLNNVLNNGYAYAGFNFGNPIFQDKKVRQALIYGLDRAAFVASFFGPDGGKVPHAPISPVSWAYPDESTLNKYEYNLEKAKTLLEEAGWKVGAGGIREKDGKKLAFNWISYQEAAWSGKITALAKDQWLLLGVDLTVELMDFNSVVEKIGNPANKETFGMWNMAWGLAADPDMSGIFSKTQFTPGNNRGYFDNPEIEKLMNDGLKELDQTKRVAVYQELAKLFNEEVPYIYVYTRMNPWLVNNRIKNFNPSELLYWTNNSHLIEIAK